LEAGLRWLADGFTARTGIEVKVQSSWPGRLPDETETCLFRIAQEALTNIARHSGAKRATIALESGGESIRLTVQDDGHGLDPSAVNGRGLGLTGIRARARSAGGEAQVRSRPGEGVAIEVRVPICPEAHPQPAG